ncbi:TetR/AcrR family transcriptional regulator (plasmid) [Ensifer adhaerens]|uniref:TetR/AcrR family transcriptional regulator n=1 Tax=Ensifer adhaerens TaxID=106592 RepID=UPI000DE3AE81|nr:TetR/AcrR family transcriptional regulator [Ensifer adhaerens]MBZ7927342.1 TetR/AcrR family transcriptional regulator [Ensifer adhaerens]UAX98350.1 TetR/AcrR family transcriptional regulator [Ensifer adhaerens]UAY05733.1 TetR/AcrR family transcriptional regulator [Ensifer adhaerens]UAY13111.1 TetR/AcrR family transcriptional regulator [Ensifer adhaerens]
MNDPKKIMKFRKSGDEIKALIVNAATRVVMERGAARMTLADVATEAGISKGGLLHYFSSKDDLIRAMIAAGLESFEEKTMAMVAADPTAGSYLRAYITTSFPAEGADDIAAAMIAGIASDIELLAEYSAENAKWSDRLEKDGLDYFYAQVIRLAVDGLYFSEAIGLPQFKPEDRKAFLQRLLSMTRLEKPEEHS